MSDFRQLFVLKVFNQSISRPILILHLLRSEFITTFSLILAESVKICVPRGRPARVLFPDMFFFDQQGYCGCADFGVKEKVIWILRRGAWVLCGTLKIIFQSLSRFFPLSFTFLCLKDTNVHWSVWEHSIPPVKTKDSKIHLERQNT